MKKTKVKVKQRYLESMLTLRVPSQFMNKISEAAQKCNLSRSNFVRIVLEKYFSKE
jgi:predicted DNA binding CopG/RHH family protein